MKKMMFFLLFCTIVQAASPQLVSRSYRDKPMSKVLVDLRRATTHYKLSFIHNELEDYTVTKSFEDLSIPEAIQECIGFYPITMKVVDDSLIIVEAIQKTGDKLIGRIVDSKKRPVVYANIALLNVPDTTKVSSGVSNENGDFVIPTTEQQLTIRISCVGYETQILHCEPGDVGIITLNETTEHVGEVVVEGNLHIVKQDKDVYIPNQRQRNAANDGLGLLANLGIPQLDVNPITKSIGSNSGQSVSLYIDGRKVNLSEVQQLRPKDILRVEFIDTPTGKYANDELVVNYILRHYDYGGYVSARSNTQFLNSAGQDAIQANFDHRQMHYAVVAGLNYSNSRDNQENTEEDVTTGSKTFHRSNSTVYDHVKQWSPYGQVQAKYKTEKLMLSAGAGARWTIQPEYANHQQLTYTGDVTGSTTATRIRDSRDVDPYAYIYADCNPSKKQSIQAYAEFNFGNHRYNSYQNEEGYEVVTNTKEHVLTSQMSLNYIHNLRDKDQFYVYVIDFYKKYDDHYMGTTISDQRLYSNELLVFPTYVHYFGQKLYTSLRPLGFSIINWGTEHYSERHLSSRAAATARYTPSKQHVFSAAVYLGNNNPSPSETSELDQVMNQYESLRGNPKLGKMVFETEYLTYNFSLKNYQLSVTARHEGIHNITKDDYYTEGERLIHSYITDGTIHDLSLRISQTLFLLNRNLQLQGRVMLERGIVTGLHGGSHNQPHAQFNARYYIGKWSFYTFYNMGRTYFGLNYAYPSYYKYPADYGVSLSYGNRGFYAEVGTRKPFTNHKYDEEWQQTQLYSFTKQTFDNSKKPWVYVRLSYNFDFGRKTKHEDIEVNQSTSSAILGK